MKNKKKEKLEKKVVEVALIQGTPMHQPVQQQSFNVHEFLPARQWHLQFSLSVMSNSLQPHGLQHTRLPHPSPTPRAYSNSCPSPQWCHQTSSSSVIPFSSRLQSFPASGFFRWVAFYDMSSILWHVIGTEEASQRQAVEIALWVTLPMALVVPTHLLAVTSLDLILHPQQSSDSGWWFSVYCSLGLYVFSLLGPRAFPDVLTFSSSLHSCASVFLPIPEQNAHCLPPHPPDPGFIQDQFFFNTKMK